MRLLLAGASGQVGGHVLAAARQGGHDCVVVTRRPLGTRETEVLTEFTEPPALPGADAAICALGTTIARAGSQEAFYTVDHDAVLVFAEAARAAGVPHFLVVTAVGANPRAKVFYSRVKGEVERDLAMLAFRRLDIAQPGLLLGYRKERRPVEQLLKTMDPLARRFMPGRLRRYAGIEAATLARALLRLAEAGGEAGVFRHDNRSLEALAR